jgi:hypothetical protein
MPNFTYVFTLTHGQQRTYYLIHFYRHCYDHRYHHTMLVCQCNKRSLSHFLGVWSFDSHFFLYIYWFQCLCTHKKWHVKITWQTEILKPLYILTLYRNCYADNSKNGKTSFQPWHTHTHTHTHTQRLRSMYTHKISVKTHHIF